MCSDLIAIMILFYIISPLANSLLMHVKRIKKAPASDITSNAGATLTLMNVLQSTSISINEGSDSAPTISLQEAELRA